MAIFDDNDMSFPESEEEFEEESSNRTFIIAASVLGGIILLSLICVAAYALVIAPRQKQQSVDAEATRVAQNTQVAEMLTATGVANALALTAQASPTAVASPTASPTPNLAARNCEKVSGMADPSPETAYRMAHRNSTLRRPNLSLRKPATMAPGMQPRMALAAAIPSCTGLSAN